MEERGWKGNVDQMSPHCPRCGSSNTKFCYYNNYSLTQPRYFCKGCRRYWTRGGSLRNVPIGGGCRKTRRAKSLRVSIDTHRCSPSKSGAYGGAPIIGSTTPNGNHLAESTSGGSSIDLAAVYANFLNQPSDSRPVENDLLPELPGDINPSNNLEFPSVADTNEHEDMQLPQELAGANSGDMKLPHCSILSDHQSMEIHPINNNNSPIYLGEFDSFHNQQDRIQNSMTIHSTGNYGLPPLPGEEEATQEVSWPNSQMMVHNQEAQELNQLVGDWSAFNLPSF